MTDIGDHQVVLQTGYNIKVLKGIININLSVGLDVTESDIDNIECGQDWTIKQLRYKLASEGWVAGE